MAKSSGSGLLHNSTGGHTTPTDRGTSASQGNAVGSGNRPTKSVHPIATAAAMDPKTQGREPSKDPGTLK
jgi:hypothetical protein